MGYLTHRYGEKPPPARPRPTPRLPSYARRLRAGFCGNFRGKLTLQWRNPTAQADGPGRAGHGRITGSSAGRTMGRLWCRKDIGDTGQSLLRFLVIGDDRLAADVARGRHDGLAVILQQLVVQRAVRQEHTQFGEAGRQRQAQAEIPRACAPARWAVPDRRWRAAVSSSTSSCSRHRIQAILPCIGNITASGLAGRCLRCTQTLNGRIIGRVTDQVIATDAFDRNDLPRIQGSGWPARAGHR